jgi:energy-coupling factor transporter ATP-binding protein EcfA2
MSKTIEPFSFQYHHGKKKLTLREPLVIEDNKIIWLVGNSGSGKSTLLHLLKGFYPEFLSGELSSHSVGILEKASYLAQNPLTQIVHEKVGEEFFFSMENAQYSPNTMEQKKVWMKKFGFDNKEFENTQNLSHGFAQRLLLTSMLATNPEWLLLDEPTAFLDPVMRSDFYTILTSLKNEIGIFIIDHHKDLAQIADTCIHISDEGIITPISIEKWLLIQSQQEIQSTKKIWEKIIYPCESVKLTTENLTIGYSEKKLFSANITLNSGDCAVLIGENGTGKSTFFNTLAGIQKPLEGRIDFQINQKAAKISEHMAYIFQHPDSHFFFDTLAEELEQLGLQETAQVLDALNLNDDSYSPHRLSEGQKRRLTLLYPILQNRSLILLDEPTFGQDTISTHKIIELIQELKKAGYALIVITHDSYVQKAIATKVWRIQNGVLEHV